MGKPRKPPVVANPAAQEQLERAAAASGLSIQELADLVFEAGVVPPRAKDGLTERYTLKDLGEKLWGAMQGVAKSERALWFASLVPIQKAAMVVTLRDQGYRTEVIARELGIETSDVTRTWNAYASQLGSQVVGLRLDTIAGQLQMAAERAQEMAIAAGDHSAYWRIHKELVSMLQSIGIVDQAIRRVEVTHRLDDEQKAELERLAELRNKQRVRKEEVKLLVEKAEEGDELPDDIEEDYDEE